MREIKFRAWHKNRKTFLDFYWAVDKLGRTFSILDKYVYDEFTDEIELMQYTGLKDMNGVEIYEGDVVRFVTNVQILESEVTYCHGMFTIKKYGEKIPLFTGLKVIGNRFENPELLEG